MSIVAYLFHLNSQTGNLFILKTYSIIYFNIPVDRKAQIQYWQQNILWISLL